MVSYVRRSSSGEDAEREASHNRAKIDAAAIAEVLRYEKGAGREPVPMEHHNPGYDIESTDASGNVRYIEVKGTSARWAERGVAITRTQFLYGRRLDDDYWLYVVEQATTSPVVHAIQNPMAQITRYVFDGGWREIEEVDQADLGVEELRLSQAADGLRNPVPFKGLGFITGELKVRGFLDLDEPASDDVVLVRIEDEGLGMAMRGGLAFVRPCDGVPDDDDLVAVVVKDPTDGGTRRILVRLWAAFGGPADEGQRVELTGAGSMEPVLHRLDDVEVIGLVEDRWRLDELADRGLLLEEEE